MLDDAPLDDSLDKMRKEIQESLIESKREQLQDEYGMVMDHVSSDLSPQAHNEWLDYVLEWERQFAEAKRITVRERIGDPPITPVEEIPADALGEALDRLLEMLFE